LVPGSNPGGPTQKALVYQGLFLLVQLLYQRVGRLEWADPSLFEFRGHGVY
jgi:hypothetical protein